MKDLLEVIEESSGINAIPTADEYANGWNDCRKEAFQKRKNYTKAILTNQIERMKWEQRKEDFFRTDGDNYYPLAEGVLKGHNQALQTQIGYLEKVLNKL